jgi:hypothetical protein
MRRTVLAKEMDLVKSVYERYGLDKAYVLYWNSCHGGKNGFVGGHGDRGVFTFNDKNGDVTPIDYNTAELTSQMICDGNLENKGKWWINSYSITFPWIGIDKIQKKWIKPGMFTNIYLVTDGQIGYPKPLRSDRPGLTEEQFILVTDMWEDKMVGYRQNLTNSIKKTLKLNNNIRFNILTVENCIMNYGDTGEMTTAAGADICKVLHDNGLMEDVSEFVSYSWNNLDGFVQYRNTVCPPGFHPFRDKVFKDRDSGKFFAYLADIITDMTTSELQDLLNDISKTAQSLIYDKPQKYKDAMIEMFCRFFEQTSFSPVLARMVIQDAITKSEHGTAQVYADFRKNIQNLFKQADGLLKSNVKNSIHFLSDEVMSLPLTVDGLDTVYAYPSTAMDKTLRCRSGTFPNSCVEACKKFIPMMPMHYHRSVLSDQCMRQWVRAIASSQYGLNVRDDRIFYLFMAKTLQMALSDVPDIYKDGYRTICQIMLGKKRLNTNITELENYMQGHPPKPNVGGDHVLSGDLAYVGQSIGLDKLQPFTLWYVMCLGFNHKNLADLQKIHCKDNLDTDGFGDMSNEEILEAVKKMIRPVVMVKGSDTTKYDYQCVWTMEDTSDDGGYVINEHLSNGIRCTPRFVLSEDGHEAMLEDAMYCPMCRTDIDESYLTKVGPLVKDDVNIPDGVSGAYSEFYASTHGAERNKGNKGNHKGNGSSKSSHYDSNTHALGTTTSKQNKFVVFMGGTVGAGKSTASSRMLDFIQMHGGKAIVVGTDKHCVKGFNMRSSIGMVNKEIEGFASKESKVTGLSVIIVDTCNEKNPRVDNVFKVNLSGWTKLTFKPNMYWEGENYESKRDYMAWCLDNVLNRQSSNANSSFWLNPRSAGVDVCVSVCKNKMKGHFGAKSAQLDEIPSRYNPSFKERPRGDYKGVGDIQAVKSAIKARRDRYAERLAKFDLTDRIKQFLTKKNVIS